MSADPGRLARPGARGGYPRNIARFEDVSMQRPIPIATVALALVTALAAGRGEAIADDSPGRLLAEGIRWPGEGGRTIEVSVGIVVIDFARINLREESFDMAGYLDTSWTDPGLALGPGEPRRAIRRFRPGQIWSPALEFVNAVEQVISERDGDLYVTEDGRVSQRVRFSHRFQSPLHLLRFPFDRQTLTVVVAPFDPFARDLVLVKDPRRVGQLEAASVPDWNIDAVGARVAPGGEGRDGGGQFLFEVRVSRRSTYYIWRVLLPLTLLVIASWTVFWFDVTALQPQISTCLAILLSMVTFNYAIDFSLPKVPYLTFTDRYTLASFAFALSVIFAVTALHVIFKGSGEARALRFQRRARWAFPVAYLATALAISVRSLL